VSLGFNFFWSIIFFNFGAYFLAFLWLLLLLYFVVKTAIGFFGINKWAGLLFIPYIAWVVFAGYLNIAIAFLN
jgi:tryptophan-rich sensory protein